MVMKTQSKLFPQAFELCGPTRSLCAAALKNHGQVSVSVNSTRAVHLKLKPRQRLCESRVQAGLSVSGDHQRHQEPWNDYDYVYVYVMYVYVYVYVCMYTYI